MLVRERYIRSFDGTELYTTTAGQGPAIALCDGLGCDGFIWRYLHAVLIQHYQVIHWNYRGHGLSRPPPKGEAFTMATMRRDLHAVLDAYGVRRACLMGHSMGVQLILDFALAHPDRVWAMVPICGSYGRPLDTLHGDGRISNLFPLVEEALRHFPRISRRLWKRAMLSRVSYAFAAAFEVNGKVVRPEDFKPYFRHLASMDPDVFIQVLHAAQEHSVEDLLTDIRTRTLVITGERDTFTPMWLSLRMHRRIPNAELLVMPGGSHVAPIEIPELINLRLERFLLQHVHAAESPVVYA